MEKAGKEWEDSAKQHGRLRAQAGRRGHLGTCERRARQAEGARAPTSGPRAAPRLRAFGYFFPTALPSKPPRPSVSHAKRARDI